MINHNEDEDENENGPHKNGLNRPRSRHVGKFSKYKTCLSITMLIYIKQPLSNIWSSIREKVKQHWGWVEKIAFLIKKRVNRLYSTIPIEIWLF